ncbi:hypothetical protein D8B29_24075 [Verminephrobacter eiseniae]|nr:hypothetical protein [Verminephrobacter eiseniae]
MCGLTHQNESERNDRGCPAPAERWRGGQRQGRVDDGERRSVAADGGGVRCWQGRRGRMRASSQGP